VKVLKTETVEVRSTQDVVIVRQRVRSMAIECGFSLVDQTKIVTAASEIARNTVIYGGGGQAIAEHLENERRQGVRLTFEDEGPGIADLSMALKEGYTTGGGLGLGLSGAKRLSNEFEITSAPGKGTRVVLARWK
jgi:serine/threonine-protein kinase RsbT